MLHFSSRSGFERPGPAVPGSMKGDPMSDPKSDADNHANQCNPNNDAYWSSRGYSDDDDEA